MLYILRNASYKQFLLLLNAHHYRKGAKCTAQAIVLVSTYMHSPQKRLESMPALRSTPTPQNQKSHYPDDTGW